MRYEDSTNLWIRFNCRQSRDVSDLNKKGGRARALLRTGVFRACYWVAQIYLENWTTWNPVVRNTMDNFQDVKSDVTLWIFNFISKSLSILSSFSPNFPISFNLNLLHRYLGRVSGNSLESRRRDAVEQLVYLCARDSRTKSSFHGNAIPANLRIIQLHLSQDRFWSSQIGFHSTSSSSFQLIKRWFFWRIVFTYISFSSNFFRVRSYYNCVLHGLYTRISKRIYVVGNGVFIWKYWKKKKKWMR